MKKVSIVRSIVCAACVTLELIGFSVVAQSKPRKISLRKAVECAPRSGLPNFFAKCEKGGTVKVAYLGGSITKQAGWRIQSLDLLRNMYPKVNFEEINAAMGGTGSNIGVFRLESDVLEKKPDLLFVEFGVNDSAIKKSLIPRSMEGIVRNTWKVLPECEICFVYTLTTQGLKLLKNGKFNVPVTLHEEIAEHYGIPTIHMGMEVARLEKEEKLLMKAPNAKVKQVAGKELDRISGIQINSDGKIPFSRDGVHPYLDTGHKLYTDAIERSLPLIKTASTKPSSHSNLAPPLSDYVKSVSFYPVEKAQMKGSWEKLENLKKIFKRKNLTEQLSCLWKAEPGAELSFKFKGRSFMLYSLSGPGTGLIEVTIDGQASEKHNNFDDYCSYWRISPYFPATDLSPKNIHKAIIKVLPDKIDKRTMLMRLRPKAYDKNPDAFKPTNFFIGGIYIEGEMLNGAGVPVKDQSCF